MMRGMAIRILRGRLSFSAGFRIVALGITALGLSALSGCGPRSDGVKPGKQIEIRRYGLASAEVDYEVSGIKVGRERFYFDHWGTREARYSHATTQMLGMSSEEDILKVVDGAWSYTIDLHKGTGTREPNPLLITYAKKIRQDGRLLLGDELMKDMGARKAGSRTILGRTCQLWVAPLKHAQYCLWKNLVLLTRVQDGDAELITKAVAIAENVPVKNDVFKIPASVVIAEAVPAPAK
jgi:hypothetical protein